MSRYDQLRNAIAFVLGVVVTALVIIIAVLLAGCAHQPIKAECNKKSALLWHLTNSRKSKNLELVNQLLASEPAWIESSSDLHNWYPKGLADPNIAITTTSNIELFRGYKANSSAPLTWDRMTNVSFRLYYGPKSRYYTNHIDVGTNNYCILSRLPPGCTNYIAATDYDVHGNESDYSVEYVYVTPIGSTNGLVLSILRP